MWLETPYRQIGIFFVVLAIVWLARLVYQRFFTDPVVAFSEDDPEMLDAKDRALSSLPAFWQALRSARPENDLYALKVRYAVGENSESVWLMMDPASPDHGKGRLMNRPQLLDAREGQELGFEDSQIVDWMYRENGKLIGGESLRLMIRKSPPRQARKMARLYGLEAP
jgi:uncharacterized protein YegJ (DUF2314 family)